MGWCTVQTNDYDLPAKKNKKQIPVFPGTTEKYDNGKGGYFGFDDDNNMSYRYILSII